MDNRKDDHNNDNIEINESTLPVVEQIADCMPGGFFIYKAHGGEELIYYNKALLRIFGCETKEEFEELTGNSFRGIVHPDDLEMVEKSIEEQIESSRYALDYVEYRILKKDGTVCWVEDYGHFAHTAVYGDVFYVFIEDVTARMQKRAAEMEHMNAKLKEAHNRESQYKKAILHNSISFYEVNLSQDKFMTTASQVLEGRVVDVFESMGIQPVTRYSDFVDILAEQVSEDERAAFRQFFNIERLIRCFNKGDLEQVYETWSVDGLGRHRLSHYALMLGSQEHTGDIISFVVCTDITEQIERQNLLQIALRQAQSANIARSAFLMSMSHDIRTPLNAIIGYTDLLLSQSRDEKTLDYVGKIKQASGELLSIVKESLEVTWVESGKAVLVESCCDIEEVVHEAARDISLQMRKKQLDFAVDCSGVRHKNIYADTIRLQEILSQLLDNAVKYTDEGGHVRLAVREEPNAPEGYGQFVFSVQDDGIGIPDDFKQNLFQAFSREKNTTMSKVLGTGLGLAVVKTYVEMMEGSINVESKVGEGSTFAVKILFKLDEASREEPVKVKVLDRSALIGKNILLVEDNELNAEIAQELLAQSGFVIEKAENGQVAVEKVQEAPPGYYCVVLMDIQMPVMDGYEATRQIRQLTDSKRANVPIVALSANAFPEDQQRSIECGMDAHFPKPIDIEGLIDLLCRVLAKVL